MAGLVNEAVILMRGVLYLISIDILWSLQCVDLNGLIVIGHWYNFSAMRDYFIQLPVCWLVQAVLWSICRIARVALDIVEFEYVD